MKLQYLILIILFSQFYIFSLDLSSDKSINLSLEDSLSLALKNNIDLKKEETNIKEKRLNLYTSFNKYYPDISLSSSIGLRHDIIKNSTSNSLSAGFSFSFSISAKTAFEIYETLLDYDAGKITYESARSTLFKNIKKSYFNIVLLRQEINLKKKSIENAKKRYDRAVIQFKEGDISELDILNEEFSYKSLIPDSIKLQNDFENTLNQFKIILGIKLSDKIELTDTIPTILNHDDIKSLDYNDIEKNYDIVLLNIKLNKDINNQNITISSFTPTITFSYSLNSSFASDKNPFKDDWIDTSNWNNNQSLSFSLRVPLKSALPFSTEQTQLIKNRYTINKTLMDIEKNKEIKKNELLNYILKIKQIEESIDSLKFNLEIAEKIYNLTENSYYQGEKNRLELNEADKNREEALLKLNRAYYDFYINFIEIEYIVN